MIAPGSGPGSRHSRCLGRSLLQADLKILLSVLSRRHRIGPLSMSKCGVNPGGIAGSSPPFGTLQTGARHSGLTASAGVRMIVPGSIGVRLTNPTCAVAVLAGHWCRTVMSPFLISRLRPACNGKAARR